MRAQFVSVALFDNRNAQVSSPRTQRSARKRLKPGPFDPKYRKSRQSRETCVSESGFINSDWLRKWQHKTQSKHELLNQRPYTYFSFVQPIKSNALHQRYYAPVDCSRSVFFFSLQKKGREKRAPSAKHLGARRRDNLAPSVFAGVQFSRICFPRSTIKEVILKI